MAADQDTRDDPDTPQRIVEMLRALVTNNVDESELSA
jgi:hypothetical protein